MFKGTKAFSSFSVDDMKKAKAFYAGTLGLDVNEVPEGLELHLAGGGFPSSSTIQPITTRRSTRFSISWWMMLTKRSTSL